MKSILEELYHGNLCLDEGLVPDDPEYRALNQQIIESLDNWKKKLPEGDFNGLESLLGLQCRTDSMEATVAFQSGFKLGALIMLEVLSGKEGLVRGRD